MMKARKNAPILHQNGGGGEGRGRPDVPFILSNIVGQRMSVFARSRVKHIFTREQINVKFFYSAKSNLQKQSLNHDILYENTVKKSETSCIEYKKLHST